LHVLAGPRGAWKVEGENRIATATDAEIPNASRGPAFMKRKIIDHNRFHSSDLRGYRWALARIVRVVSEQHPHDEALPINNAAEFRSARIRLSRTAER
jgi:hypothetical protein